MNFNIFNSVVRKLYFSDLKPVKPIKKEAANFLKTMRQTKLTNNETEIIKKNIKKFDRLD